MFVRKESKPQLFYVLNQDGEVYTGMVYGQFNYSANWEEGKPLRAEGTRYLKRANPKIELVKEEELW